MAGAPNESRETLLRYLEELSGRRLASRSDVRALLQEKQTLRPEQLTSVRRWRNAKRATIGALLGFAVLQYHEIGHLIPPTLQFWIFLGFFFDWIEITLIVLPVFAPIIAELDFGDHVARGEVVYWFAILMAVNLQTSFLTPPFGFSLFYLGGVAQKWVNTGDIYRGVIPFIALQLLMLGLLLATGCASTSSSRRCRSLRAASLPAWSRKQVRVSPPSGPVTA